MRNENRLEETIFRAGEADVRASVAEACGGRDEFTSLTNAIGHPEKNMIIFRVRQSERE